MMIDSYFQIKKRFDGIINTTSNQWIYLPDAQGLPGAYTEDAALKAYPKCETVPCVDFDTAFKVPLFLSFSLSLWIWLYALSNRFCECDDCLYHFCSLLNRG